MCERGRARALCDGEREGRSSEWWAREGMEEGGGGRRRRDREREEGGGGARDREEAGGGAREGLGGGRRCVPCNASRCAARRTVRCGDGERVVGSDGCRCVREGDARARGGSWRPSGGGFGCAWGCGRHLGGAARGALAGGEDGLIGFPNRAGRSEARPLGGLWPRRESAHDGATSHEYVVCYMCVSVRFMMRVCGGAGVCVACACASSFLT